MPLEVVVLAAGNSKRMRTRIPKVFHDFLGKPMLAHVLGAVELSRVSNTHVVIQPGMRDQAVQLFGNDINWVLQDQQRGTAHAVQQAIPDIDSSSRVLVVNGDAPLLTRETLERILAEKGDAVLVVSAEVSDPTGYGRIVRDAEGRVCAIVEERDATPAQRLIREVNSGAICAPAGLLKKLISQVKNSNKQSEYYLTDIVGLAMREQICVNTVKAQFPEEVLGINDRVQLAEAERIAAKIKARQLMYDGLTLKDPSRFDLRGSLTTGSDCLIDINVIIKGTVRLGEGVSIGAGCVLCDVDIDDGAQLLEYSMLESASVGKNCVIGPFARIRPGSIVEEDAKIGNFVEVKASRIGRGTKANHLAYIGDADVGVESNIGAGAITCNFDGLEKHQTLIGENVFVGTNCTLVAPLKIDSGSFIAAGSTITKDVPAAVLAIGRNREQILKRWKSPADRGKR